MKQDRLGRPVERHDGQIPPSLVKPDPRNNWALEHSLRSSLSAVDLVWRPAAEPGMRTMPGIPFEED